LDSKFIAELLKCLTGELGPVIVDDSSGHTKAVEHVMLDEVDRVWCLYFLQGNNFYPFREVIGYGQDEEMSFGCWRTDGSNKSILHISNGHEEDVG